MSMIPFIDLGKEQAQAPNLLMEAIDRINAATIYALSRLEKEFDPHLDGETAPKPAPTPEETNVVSLKEYRDRRTHVNQFALDAAAHRDEQEAAEIYYLTRQAERIAAEHSPLTSQQGGGYGQLSA